MSEMCNCGDPNTPKERVLQGEDVEHRVCAHEWPTSCLHPLRLMGDNQKSRPERMLDAGHTSSVTFNSHEFPAKLGCWTPIHASGSGATDSSKELSSLWCPHSRVATFFLIFAICNVPQSTHSNRVVHLRSSFSVIRDSWFMLRCMRSISGLLNIDVMIWLLKK